MKTNVGSSPESVTEFKHTPGPWGLIYNEDGTLEVGMAGTNRITGVKSEAGFGQVAMVIEKKTNILGDSKTLQYKTFEANAKLIAAAPELLRTLAKLYMSVYGGNSTSLKDCMNRSVNSDEFEQEIVSAIKKATE